MYKPDIDIEGATNQDLFDFMVAHLRKQGKPALAPSGYTCMYRTKDKLMCAVGCLISDEDYSEDMEGFTAPDALRRLGFSFEQLGFLSYFQYRGHDTVFETGAGGWGEAFEDRLLSLKLELEKHYGVTF